MYYIIHKYNINVLLRHNHNDCIIAVVLCFIQLTPFQGKNQMKAK